MSYPRSLIGAIVLVSAMAAVAVPSATDAVHFYRGPGSGCTPADGALTDDGSAPSVHTVLLLHNTFHDSATGLPVTIVNAGDSVTWVWNSEHCHSAQQLEGEFYSGFHYPADEPTTPPLLPGLFHYPVPTLAPTLSFTHTFDTAGTYQYQCEHHAIIGMRGVVVVQ